MDADTLKHANQQTARHDGDAKTIFGFWVYLMTDCILFASLFATYAVLRNNTYGGPGADELFSLPFVLIETIFLLTSSFVCGLAMLAMHRRNKDMTLILLAITALLGLAFLALELAEFSHLATTGDSWQRSGFLSAFFTLVGTHGLHITVGLIWVFTMMAQLIKRGFTHGVMRRLTLFSLFWHFLDIIWIFIFTIVYLLGAVG
ncbi:MAG: cytochrome o ubiquinol oxidase subunit III [Candidatus Saccharimonadales bacterium]